MGGIKRSKPLRRTPLKRSAKPIARTKAVNKVRSKPRPGRLKGKALQALRRDCYERDDGKCVKCGKWLPFDGPLTVRMHMAHIKNKRMWGDTLENVATKCYECHIEQEHRGGKVVPPKP